MSTSVRTAVIPAAGLGTRFLPATKAMPKEMLTVVDRPSIQWVVEEAVAAGIDDIVIITSPTRRRSKIISTAWLNWKLRSSPKKREMLGVVRHITDLATFHFTRQGAPSASVMPSARPPAMCAMSRSRCCSPTSYSPTGARPSRA